MSDEASSDGLHELERRAFLKRMIAAGFALPLVTTFEPSEAAAHHKRKHPHGGPKTTTTTTSTAAPTTQPPPTTLTP